ncbi:DUF2946 family protein [Sinisalibacter aestuarii]|uniref:DUF2946 family protein n=1 Tax=Sinisalibacter aestuarii TaxID=2949426 RepID=UPI002490E1F1|nr:DUF2946 family protein [Sinisalibacter aestuarii]
MHALVRTVALFAMAVQVLFYADHIGAVAARSTGNAGLDARLGILEICTGNGIELIGPDGQPVPQDHDCPICENASVMAFGEPAAMPSPDFPFVTFAVVWALPLGAHMAEMRFPGEQPIRAPPPFSLA